MAIRGERRRLGYFGERKAARFLKKNGYKILNRNFKCKSGEIDIIASKGDTIAFVEVKTRSSDAFGEPCEAVDYTRQRRYCNAAEQFIRLKGIGLETYVLRFDIIEIKKGVLNHIENAFEWR